MGLTLLAHSSMPLKFWDEAFLTAVFLINRLPSKVINHETPIGCLHGHEPNYAFLRTFSCAVWPNLRPYNACKLQFRSKQCVFLGYSDLHKVYKCLDPADGRVYISRDVVFDELVFPFASLRPNASARLRAEIQLLPDVLLNPSSQFGDAFVHDRHLSSPMTTDTVLSSSVDVLPAGKNLAVSGDHTMKSALCRDPYFMCLPAGGSNNTQADTPAHGNRSDPGSSLVSACRTSSFAAGERMDVGGGSSTSILPGSPSASTRVLPQADPVEGGQHTSAAPEVDLATGSPVDNSGSGVTGDSLSPTAAWRASPPRQPITRLQRGISKPKQYTNGTMRWCMVTTAACEEPAIIDEALGDPKWVAAMNDEHQALLQNGT